MPKNDKYYKRMSDSVSPGSAVVKNCIKAFFAGGAICAAGQGINDTFLYFGTDKISAGIWTSVILIFISALLTGTGIYWRIAKHA